jgi:hypothetical protein
VDKPVTNPTPTSGDELLALARRAEGGDRTALLALRELLNDSQAVDRLGGDLARHAQLTLISKFGGKNLLFSGTHQAREKQGHLGESLAPEPRAGHSNLPLHRSM